MCIKKSSETNIVSMIYRNASKHEIMKAYRRLAVKWHPDKYDGNDKAHAEKMFIDIAAAKEVLTDPGKFVYPLCFAVIWNILIDALMN